MTWQNTLRRWFNLPENPPATSGDTSVLFVLESAYPSSLSLAELRDMTRIPYGDLRREMERLIWMRKVRVEIEPLGVGDAARRYWIVHRQEDGTPL
jgi:hypothetical protein